MKVRKLEIPDLYGETRVNWPVFEVFALASLHDQKSELYIIFQHMLEEFYSSTREVFTVEEFTQTFLPVLNGSLVGGDLFPIQFDDVSTRLSSVIKAERFGSEFIELSRKNQDRAALLTDPLVRLFIFSVLVGAIPNEVPSVLATITLKEVSRVG